MTSTSGPESQAPSVQILIAEDTIVQGKVLVHHLEKLGYQVAWAKNGKEALDLLLENPEKYSLVLTDMYMPEMDGLDLLRQIRKNARTHTIPVVVVTSLSEENVEVAALREGANDFLSRPFKPEELELRTKNLIRLHQYEKLLVSENFQLNRSLLEKNVMLERNLKELQKTQAQLVQTSKLAGLAVMGGGIAHEINSPLNAITLCNELILSIAVGDSPDKVEIREMVGKVNQAAEKITKIVSHVKKFSRSSTDKAALAIIDVNQAIAHLEDFYREKLSLHSIELTQKLLPEPLRIHASQTAIEHIFLSLIHNAIDAMEKTPIKNLTIRTARDGDHALVQITDTGHGIAKEHADKIYDPFFTTREPGKGTGLGLSITRTYLDDYQGRIDFETSPSGTTFSVRIPIFA